MIALMIRQTIKDVQEFEGKGILKYNRYVLPHPSKNFIFAVFAHHFYTEVFKTMQLMIAVIVFCFNLPIIIFSSPI